MAKEGKLLVIGAILRFDKDKPFRLSHLTQLTGMSRQAVYHHIKMFEEKEYISKSNTNYYLQDKEALLEEMDDAVRKRNDAELLTDHTFINIEKVNTMTKIMQSFFALEGHLSMEAPELAKKLSPALNEQRVVFRDHVDACIKNFQSYKKFLSTRMKDQNKLSARKFLLKLDEDELLQYINFYCEDIAFTKEDVKFLQSSVREYNSSKG